MKYEEVTQFILFLRLIISLKIKLKAEKPFWFHW